MRIELSDPGVSETQVPGDVLLIVGASKAE